MGIVTEYADKFIEDSKRGLYRAKDLFTRGELILLPAIRKTFNSANILEVTVATTGYRGGDAGHGGRSVVRINDLGGTAIKARIIPESVHGNGGIELMLGGDCELITLIDGLRFAADALEELSDKSSDQNAAL